MDQPVPLISVFFPMYNEEENLRPSVERAQAVLRELGGDRYEIVIVDDASTDRTPQLAQELAAADPHVRVVHHPVNRSLGGAIRTGLTQCRGEAILYTDGDLPCDLGHLREALPLLADHHLVIGYRIGRRESLLRVVYSWTYNRLIRLLFGVRVRDVNFAFKLLRGEAAHALRLGSSGGFIDAELLAEAVRLRYQIAEIPVEYTPRVAGESTLARPAAILRILREMRQYWRKRHTRKG